jgi:hypothetical protein
MRQIFIGFARKKRAAKREGAEKVTLDDARKLTNGEVSI